MELMIKPHHFMDIIKLYGSGIEVFIPNKKMKHDFYRVANLIIENQNICLNLTIECDDICTPCIMCKNAKCIDKLEGIFNINQKDVYNRLLDNKIMEKLKLNPKKHIKQKTYARLCLNITNVSIPFGR